MPHSTWSRIKISFRDPTLVSHLTIISILSATWIKTRLTREHGVLNDFINKEQHEKYNNKTANAKRLVSSKTIQNLDIPNQFL